jgi:hypothetical protein
MAILLFLGNVVINLFSNVVQPWLQNLLGTSYEFVMVGLFVIFSFLAALFYWNDHRNTDDAVAVDMAGAGLLADPYAMMQPPMPRPEFVGREKQIAEVKRLLRSNGRAAITGLGGIGKTELALRSPLSSRMCFPCPNCSLICGAPPSQPVPQPLGLRKRYASSVRRFRTRYPSASWPACIRICCRGSRC